MEEKKIEVALIYRQCHTLSKDHYYTYIYHYFMNALKRNTDISMTYYSTGEIFDVKDIKQDTDIIMLTENGNTGDLCVPNEIKNIDKIDIPVISNVGDAYAMKKKDIQVNHDKYNITAYYGRHPQGFFKKYYGQKVKFQTILWGLENPLYENILPFHDRKKSKILNSGALAPTKFLSKLITRYFRHGNPENQYRLRTLCNNLPYIDYTPTLVHDYVGDRYPLLLEKYAASIAATSHCYTMKYLEIPASGCLTFMEVTDENYANELGFKDNESAIFINDRNYQEKFEEYIHDQNNKKWEDIANAGRRHVMNNLTNDHAINELVKFMDKLIN